MDRIDLRLGKPGLITDDKNLPLVMLKHLALLKVFELITSFNGGEKYQNKTLNPKKSRDRVF